MRLIVVVCLLALLSGCAPTVKTTVTRAGRAHEAATYRELAVLPFEGNAGDRISYQIEASLAGIVVAGKPYFQLVDRKQLSTVISEMKLGQSALVEPGSMARVGRLTGARGILGGMAAEQSHENRYKEERSECEEYAYTTDKDGKKRQGVCIRYKRWLATCVKRQTNVTLVPRLVDVETARVVYSRSIQRSRSSSGCLDFSTPASVADLSRRAWGEVFDELRKDLAPYAVAMEIELSDDDNGLATATDKEKFAQGLSFAAADRLDRACELWGEIAGQTVNAPFLAYNLGVCAEWQGQYERAELLYRQADRQMHEPNDRLNKALLRIRDLLAEQRMLKQQLAR